MTNLIIGGGLAAVGVLGIIVFWIMAIVKAFQAKETVWGILTIVLGMLVGLIFFFVKGHSKLGVWNLIFVLLYIAGVVVVSIAIQSNPELLEQFQPQPVTG